MLEIEWEHVAGPFNRLTEGPVWDGQKLLFTHIPASRKSPFRVGGEMPPDDSHTRDRSIA